MATPTTISSTTQQFLDIYDITNDMLIMKDGSTSLILTVDAMNFGLLAEEEQDAIMYAYASLLNSLNYTIQIVIRSQTKDATNYLNLLKEQEAKASSDDKRNQIRSYREFVGDLIRERNVLDKKFYIVIPANSLEMGLLPAQTVVPGVKQIDISTVEKSVILEKASTILGPKRDHLVSQFARIGLYARQLTTQEIIQLFYTSYNPEAAEGQQITQTGDYSTALVSGQVQMTDINPTPTQPIQPTPDQSSMPAQSNPMDMSPVTPTAPMSPTAPPSPEPTPADLQPAAGIPPAAEATPPTPMETPPAPTPFVANPSVVTNTIESVDSTSSASAPGMASSISAPQPDAPEPIIPPITQPAPTPPAPMETPPAPTPVMPPTTPSPTTPPPAPAAADPIVQEAQDVINMTAQQLGGSPAPANPAPTEPTNPSV